jgi:iron complex transport system ATP-binding protein
MFLATDRASYTYNRRTGGRTGTLPFVRSLMQIAPLVDPGFDRSERLRQEDAAQACSPMSLTPDSGTVVLAAGADGKKKKKRCSRRHIRASDSPSTPQETHPAFEYSVLEMALKGRILISVHSSWEGPAGPGHRSRVTRRNEHSNSPSAPTCAQAAAKNCAWIIASALAQDAGMLLSRRADRVARSWISSRIGLLMQRLNRERSATMVMATHDLNLAASLCDTLVLMRNGRVLASGHTSEVLTSAMVRQLYDVEADVRVHELAGHLTVVPLGRLS